MELILFSKTRNRRCSARLGHWPTLGLCALLVAGSSALTAFGLRWSPPEPAVAAQLPAVEEWRVALDEQRQAIREARRGAEEHLDALAQRLGQTQARLIRMEALGDRLVALADLDPEEFDFSSTQPSLGGPAPEGGASAGTMPDFILELDRLAEQLDDRGQQLDTLEQLLFHRHLQQASRPTGRPVRSGWLSSYYGWRTDPFTGKRAFHPGVDFAGKRGTQVLALAAGVVTWAGKRYGYGDMVEVTHGNGLVTRYAHNQRHLVKVGDVVSKGQPLALMGSSGRSTGPHVHLEVLKDGKTVNPIRYVRAKP